MGNDLQGGDIEDLGAGPILTCPAHKYGFSISSGCLVEPAGREDLVLKTFAARADAAGEISIGFSALPSAALSAAAMEDDG